MQSYDILFMFAFLPVYMGLFAITPAKHRALVMTLGNAVTAVFCGLRCAAVYALCTAVCYFSGIAIYNMRNNEQRTAMRKALAAGNFCLAAAALVICSPRGVDVSAFTPFKAAVFSVLPLNMISYIADVFRGDCEAQTNAAQLAAYLGFFPSAGYGPVYRYKTVRDSFAEPRSDASKLALGIRYYIMGLAAYTVVAVRLSELHGELLATSAEQLSGGAVWMGTLVFYAGNAAVVYDLNSGAVLNTYDTGSPIIAANDYNMNGLPEFICKHGIYAFGTSPDKDMLLRYDSLCNNITTGVIGDSIYVASSDSKDLIAYNRFLQDDEWTAVRGTEDKAGSNYSTSFSDDDYLIIAATVNDVQDIRISVIDPNDGTLRFSKDLEINGYLSNNFFVGKENGKYYGGIGSDIYLIDPENETVEKIYTKEDNDLSVSNGKIIRHESSFSGFSLTVSELDGSKPVQYAYESEEGVETSRLYKVAKQLLTAVKLMGVVADN